MRLRTLSSMVFAAVMTTLPVRAEDAPVSGVIKSYECGDNCYLTITKDSGEELTGLCAAETCGAWNEVAEMPADMVGKKVNAMVGTGKQYDGDGNEFGEFPAFSSLEIEGAAAAETDTVKGVIKSYECGDNCYLTITTDEGEELTGLCATDECASWNEVASMPEELIGRQIEAVVGKGRQYDADGNDMGEFPSFDKFIVSPL